MFLLWSVELHLLETWVNTFCVLNIVMEGFVFSVFFLSLFFAMARAGCKEDEVTRTLGVKPRGAVRTKGHNAEQRTNQNESEQSRASGGNGEQGVGFVLWCR